MKRKFLVSIIIALFFLCPQTTAMAAEPVPVTNSVSADSGITRTPAYEWHYMWKNDKLYKRLYCTTTREYISDWIPV
ncbi:MAG TPA: hypothetical protein DCZ23_01945 [Lachnospiraceae bacterium]|nr:hypothetical protein [Lachnospiraceae bacterium]